VIDSAVVLAVVLYVLTGDRYKSATPLAAESTRQEHTRAEVKTKGPGELSVPDALRPTSKPWEVEMVSQRMAYTVGGSISCPARGQLFLSEIVSLLSSCLRAWELLRELPPLGRVSRACSCSFPTE
jgi:hypothetical protein